MMERLIVTVSAQKWPWSVRDAPLDIWGGGGARVFVACKLCFLPPRVKTIFFFGDQRPTFFFYVSLKNFFVICFPYYVGYHLVFFLVNIFFINFDNKLFFSAHIFNQLFFLTFVGTNYFFQFFSRPSPPPQITNGASLSPVVVEIKMKAIGL